MVLRKMARVLTAIKVIAAAAVVAGVAVAASGIVMIVDRAMPEPKASPPWAIWIPLPP